MRVSLKSGRKQSRVETNLFRKWQKKEKTGKAYILISLASVALKVSEQILEKRIIKEVEVNGKGVKCNMRLSKVDSGRLNS